MNLRAPLKVYLIVKNGKKKKEKTHLKLHQCAECFLKKVITFVVMVYEETFL